MVTSSIYLMMIITLNPWLKNFTANEDPVFSLTATGTLSNPELQDLKFRSLCCAVEEMSLRLG